MIRNINVEEKLAEIKEYWSPVIVGELNGQHVKLVKLLGEFVWHKHDSEDEMFYVISGDLKIEFRDKTISLNPNEFTVIPKGVEHRPVAESEVAVMLFEPISTLNTGDKVNELTKKDLKRI